LCPVHAAFNTTTTGLEVPTLEHLQHKSKRKAKAKKLSFKLLSSLLIVISIAKIPFLLQKYYFFTFLKKVKSMEKVHYSVASDSSFCNWPWLPFSKTEQEDYKNNKSSGLNC
jgi:hypothetical protein